MLDLDKDLTEALGALSADIDRGLSELEGLADSVRGPAADIDCDAVDGCGERLDVLAGQGVYVLDAADKLVHRWQPKGLSDARSIPDFLHRPYVNEARMYRRPFASTTVASVYNKHSTVFLCAPIVEGATYKGLVFSALQIGAWRTPLELQKLVLDAHAAVAEVSFLLIDAHGIVLLPPTREFEPAPVDVEGEDPDANIGFDFERLRRLSRRDKLAERVWNNIVPLAQDDDIVRLSDIQMYSVVAEVPKTRWKLALSIPYPLSSSIVE